jgi:hypothetical protein
MSVRGAEDDKGHEDEPRSGSKSRKGALMPHPVHRVGLLSFLVVSVVRMV